jgi:hypothetical protein
MSEVENEIVTAFQRRDVRLDGQRAPFFRFIGRLDPELSLALLPLLPEYGSWSDMFSLAHIQCFKAPIFKLAADQIVKDEKNLAAGRPISLVGKWAPRESKRAGHLAKEFAQYLVGSQPNVKHSQVMASYRRRMSRLNRALKTVEVYECANRWDEIDPASVPAGALRVKMAAYLNTNGHDPENQKRIICGKKFQEFFKNRGREPLSPVDDARYEPVRAVVREWEEGGWRV